MTHIENILRSLGTNSCAFRELCETKVCSSNLLQDLNKALEHGGKLSTDIDEVMGYLTGIKEKLERKN